jgi:hypothetical protein
MADAVEGRAARRAVTRRATVSILIVACVALSAAQGPGAAERPSMQRAADARVTAAGEVVP